MILNEYQHDNSCKPFDVYGLGLEAWRDQVGEDVEDRIRRYAEESDGLQGFQLLADNTDAFGGLASGLVDLLADEYPRQCLLAFPVQPASHKEYSAKANSTRFLNSVLTLGSLANSEAVSLVTPLSLDTDTFSLPGMPSREFANLGYRKELNYHTSAILAAAYDTLTLPWRSASERQTRVFDIASGLGGHGRKVASVGLAMPFPLREGQFLVECLNDLACLELTSLTPASKATSFEDVKIQAVSLRGFDRSVLCPGDFRTKKEFSQHPYLDCDTIRDATKRYFTRLCPRTVTGVSHSPSPCPVSMPFPSIFKDEVSCGGFLFSGRDRRKGPVASVSAVTAWQSGKSASEHLDSLVSRASKVNLGKMQHFCEAGLEADEMEECVAKLKELRENYSETDVI